MQATLTDRFFAATILGRRLHPDSIPEWGPWDSSRLHWWPENRLDLILTTTRERKIRTTEELEARDQGADASSPDSKRVDSRAPRG